MDFDRYDRVRPIRWDGERLHLLDQRALPFAERALVCADADAVAEAIRLLVVRGAPAIGIAAAWALVLAARQCASIAELEPVLERMAQARPTAVNLRWALARMRAAAHAEAGDWRARLAAEAAAIAAEDLAANRAMGLAGADLIEAGSGVLTHCNTGSLATAGFGTALGVIRAGVAQGRIERVFATETRPWMQGARLTVWELQRDGIDACLIADSAGAHLFASGQVQWLIVGADRVCANGDVANKIGTCQLAIAARHYGVRTMVVAPTSTIDMHTARGSEIEIELRAPDELLACAGRRTVAEGVRAWNPVFDVTPAALIDVLVTERSCVRAPDMLRMRAAFAPEAFA